MSGVDTSNIRNGDLRLCEDEITSGKVYEDEIRAALTCRRARINASSSSVVRTSCD